MLINESKIAKAEKKPTTLTKLDDTPFRKFMLSRPEFTPLFNICLLLFINQKPLQPKRFCLFRFHLDTQH